MTIEPKKILIVEDEGIIALDLKRKLTHAGYQVTGTACDLPGALNLIALRKPDLVLMDIHIRGDEDGIVAAAKIRKDHRIPVIFVTAHADPQTLERARITEPFGYIVKPFAGVNFVAQIEIAFWKHAMEEKLRSSEAWLAATLEHVADGVITTDAAGNTASVNPTATRLTGWTQDEAKGVMLFEVFPVVEELTGFAAINPLESVFDGKRIDPGTRSFVLTPRRAPTLIVEAAMSANYDSEGTLLGVICTFRDVTSKRRAEALERTEQKRATVSSLAAGLAAEFGGLQRYMDAKLAQAIDCSDGDDKQDLISMYQSFRHQQVMVTRLEELSAGNHATQHLIELSVLIESAAPRLRQILGPARPLNLDMESGRMILVDGEGFRKSLLRLVEFIKESSWEGVVEISGKTVATESIKALRLMISYSGKRFSAIAAEQIFDPYCSPQSRGSAGLALAIIRQFITLNGGTIEAQSGLARPGFVITFPLASPEKENVNYVCRSA